MSWTFVEFGTEGSEAAAAVTSSCVHGRAIRSKHLLALPAQVYMLWFPAQNASLPAGVCIGHCNSLQVATLAGHLGVFTCSSPQQRTALSSEIAAHAGIPLPNGTGTALLAMPATVINSPLSHFPRLEVQISAASKPQPVPPTSLFSTSAWVHSRPPAAWQVAAA